MFEDIQSCASDEPALKHLNERGLVNDTAARHIDEQAMSAKRRQNVTIDDVTGCFATGAAGDKDVAPLSECQ
jgi:hypothetical protein